MENVRNGTPFPMAMACNGTSLPIVYGALNKLQNTKTGAKYSRELHYIKATKKKLISEDILSLLHEPIYNIAVSL